MPPSSSNLPTPPQTRTFLESKVQYLETELEAKGKALLEQSKVRGVWTWAWGRMDQLAVGRGMYRFLLPGYGPTRSCPHFESILIVLQVASSEVLALRQQVGSLEYERSLAESGRSQAQERVRQLEGVLQEARRCGEE